MSIISKIPKSKKSNAFKKKVFVKVLIIYSILQQPFLSKIAQTDHLIGSSSMRCCGYLFFMSSTLSASTVLFDSFCSFNKTSKLFP